MPLLIKVAIGTDTFLPSYKSAKRIGNRAIAADPLCKKTASM
jgi:hypothetical protein